MDHSKKMGFVFGMTSGTITTLGLMVGLHSGTHSMFVVLGGILTIAIADAFSDALGVHISEESENVHTTREVWESTITTFLAKFCVGMFFIIPVLLLPLTTAIIASVAIGLINVGCLSYYVADKRKRNAWRSVVEHIFITAVVVVITHFVGDFISRVFG